MIKKISASQLFTGYKMLDASKVLVINNNIVEAIIDRSEAGDDILQIDGLVCPGFVNAHCHMELSHMKGMIPENTGMVDFILNVLQKRNVEPDIIQQAITDAEHEMIQNGIVAVGDICNTTDTIGQKTKGNLHYTNFIEVSGFVPNAAQQRFDAGKKVQKGFIKHQLNAQLVPHAPYSVSQELFQYINNEPATISSIHYNESAAEKEFIQNGTGDFVRLYETLGIDLSFYKPNTLFSIFNKRYKSQLLVHNVVTTKDDLNNQLLVNNNQSFCLCPNANIYIGNGFADIEVLLNSGINICLGTDSLASNHQLSIWEEIQTIQKQYPAIALETLLQWATINGAKALQIDDDYGSFEKGKSGQYVVIES
jgi:aminodeoxyfutalosine deaminase